jgi:hypothetical protein
MTFSIGGFFSFERSFLNLVVASSWRSGSSERTPFIMSSSSCRVDERMQVIIRNNADRTLPSPRRCFFIGVNGSCGDKVAPLGNVFLSLLPPDLDLLLFATFPEFILFKSLCFVLYDGTLLRYGHDKEGAEMDARSLRLAFMRSAMAMRRRVVVVAVKQEMNAKRDDKTGENATTNDSSSRHYLVTCDSRSRSRFSFI